MGGGGRGKKKDITLQDVQVQGDDERGNIRRKERRRVRNFSLQDGCTAAVVGVRAIKTQGDGSSNSDWKPRLAVGTYLKLFIVPEPLKKRANLGVHLLRGRIQQHPSLKIVGQCFFRDTFSVLGRHPCNGDTAVFRNQANGIWDTKVSVLPFNVALLNTWPDLDWTCGANCHRRGAIGWKAY